MKEEEKELKIMDKLIEKVKDSHPSEFKYVKDKGRAGTSYKYIIIKENFEITLKGWKSWRNLTTKDDLSNCSFVVRGKETEDEVFSCSSDSYVHREMSDKIVNAYQKVCKSVDKYKNKEIEKRKKISLKKLEGFPELRT